ncbi:MAG: hypothetical protein ACHQ9S_25540 [Candidatus Binatia bacterium]
MRSLIRFVVTVMATVGMGIVIANGAHAGEVNLPKAAGGKTPRVYAVERSLPGARVESILADPRSVVTGTKQGTGWLLHYGTKRDNCARADVTSGLRMMCVAW